MARQKTEAEIDDVLQVLLASDDARLKQLMTMMDEPTRRKVVSAFTVRSIDKGTELITQGDEGHHCYFIQRGQFQVVVDGEEFLRPHVPDDTLGPGALFGELALLYNTRRAATITATEDSVVWELDRASFFIVKDQLEFGREAQMSCGPGLSRSLSSYGSSSLAVGSQPKLKDTIPYFILNFSTN